MKIVVDNNNYVCAYATIGDIVDSVEVADYSGDELGFFKSHFSCYKLVEGKLVLDEERIPVEEDNKRKEELRYYRQKECFSYINRGALWYDTLTEAQLTELKVWYQAWLDVTETSVKPEKPAWLD